VTPERILSKYNKDLIFLVFNLKTTSEKFPCNQLSTLLRGYRAACCSAAVENHPTANTVCFDKIAYLYQRKTVLFPMNSCMEQYCLLLKQEN